MNAQPHSLHRRLRRGTALLSLVATSAAGVIEGQGLPAKPVGSSATASGAGHRSLAHDARSEGPVHDAEYGLIPTGYRGQLSKALRKYSASELFDLAANKGWHGWVRNRKCSGSLACDLGTEHGSLLVQGIGDAHNVKFDGLGDGVVIGRIRNIGKYRDNVFPFPGGETYPSWYFFVMEPNDKRSSTIEVAEVQYDQTTGELKKELIFPLDKRQLVMTACDGHTHLDHPHGDLRTCKMPHPKNDLNGTVVVGRSTKAGSLFFATATASAWFSCNQGCCTVQPPGQLKRGDSTVAEPSFAHHRR